MGLLVCTLTAEQDAAILNSKRRWCNRCFRPVVITPCVLAQLVSLEQLEIVCTHCVTEKENRTLRAFSMEYVDSIIDEILGETG